MKQLKIVAVVLAAGNSSRMGTSKMALPWGKSTVLETTLAHVQKANIEEILLVTGGYAERVESLPLVQDIPRVHNDNFATGEMVSSVKLALATLKQNDRFSTRFDAVMVLPGDMPIVTTNLLNECVEIWRKNPTRIVAPVYAGQRGHPVIFPFMLFEEFETLPAEKSPRALLKRHQSHVLPFDLEDPAVIIDIDTPAEYEKYRPR